MNKLFIANWKMQKNYSKAIDWLKKYKYQLNDLIKNTKNHIVICPSFTVLPAIKDILENTYTLWGAQNCAPELQGAYTGDISILDLKDLKCSYCIIGHMEQRKYHCEEYKTVAQKAKLLLEHNIIPIICIGELSETQNLNAVLEVLFKQLELVLKSIKQLDNKNKKIYIAYEPGQAIGKEVPNLEVLYFIFESLQNFVNTKYSYINVSWLYGGGVNTHNIKKLKSLTIVNGFLIGSASLDFQLLKKIVLL